MAQANLSIVIDVHNRTARELNNIKRSLKSVSGNFSTEMNIIRKAGKWAGIGLAAVGAGATALGISMVKSGKDLTRVNATIKVLSKNLNVSKETLREWDRELEKANTRGINAARTKVRFMQSGIMDLDVSFKDFIKTSKNFAASIGVSSGKAIDDFTKALLRMQPDLLDNYGITLNLIEVYRKYAKAQKITSAELTDAQRKQALYNEIMEQGKKVMGVYEETYGTLGKNLNSIKDGWINVKAAFGQVLEQPVTVWSNALVKSLKKIQLWAQDNEETLKRWGDSLRTFSEEALNNLTNKVKSFIDAHGGMSGLMEEAKNKLKDFWTVIVEDIIPTIKFLWDSFSTLASFIMKHRKAVLLLIGVYEALKVAMAISTVIGAVTSALGGLSGAMTGATGTAGALIGGSTAGLIGLAVILGTLATVSLIKARKSVRELKKEMGELHNTADTVRQRTEAMNKRIGEIKTEEARKQFKKMGESAIKAADDADKMAERYEGAMGVLNAVIDGTITAFSKLVRKAKSAAEKVASAFKKAGKSGGGGGGGGGGSWRATGGTVFPGKRYTVGENGEETFIPAIGGKIENSVEETGNSQVFNFDFSGATITNKEDLIREIKQALDRDTRLAQFNVNV